EGLREREPPLLEYAEERAFLEGQRPLFGRRSIRRNERRDQLTDLLVQRGVMVAGVPDQCDGPSPTQHAVELGNRLVVAEPVKRLADGDRIHRVIAERNRLCRAA